MRLLICLFVGFIFFGQLYAQKDLPIMDKKQGIVRQQSILLQIKDPNGDDSYEPYETGKGSPKFRNVNRRYYFHDKKQLARLAKLEGAGEDERVEYETALASYVSKFGVKNFTERAGVEMLWKLGRLRQLSQDTVEALYLYELASKHTRSWDAPKLSYDSVKAPTKSEWLSIDEYYKLLDFRKKIDPLIPAQGILQNMGTAINSDEADYAPFMHPSDSVLIFTSRRGKKDLIDPFAHENEELYVAIKNFVTGHWDEAERLTDSINTEFNEGSACLSPDGKTLYFTRCNSPDGRGDCDIYQATWTNGGWIDIHNLGKNINSTEWDSQPNISEDGNILFFSSNRKGGFGSIDIYFTTRHEDGHWGRAENLGPMINTPTDEVSPFFHSINNTLYFGSRGQLKNYGGFDIFRARWLDGQWEQPKNVGPLINSFVNEYYFTIDSDGENLYYSSSKRGELEISDQDFDLYSFSMPMESRPSATTKLSGVLIDSVSGYPLVGVVMIVDLDNGVEIAPKRINEKGYFEFDLKNDNRYRIYVIGENFLTIRNDIVLSGDTSFQVITQSIKENKPLVFESLEFGTNSAQLKGNARPKLDYIVKFLERYPMFKLTVEGHTDSNGSPDYNKELSLQRARQIQAYVETEGKFPQGRILAEGHGEAEPLVPNDSEANMKKNRRVEFRLEWIEDYDGDMYLPMEEELHFDDEFMDEEKYDLDELEDEWDFFNEDWETDDEDDLLDLDLDAELDDDMDDLLFEGGGGF